MRSPIVSFQRTRERRDILRTGSPASTLEQDTVATLGLSLAGGRLAPELTWIAGAEWYPTHGHKIADRIQDLQRHLPGVYDGVEIAVHDARMAVRRACEAFSILADSNRCLVSF